MPGFGCPHAAPALAAVQEFAAAGYAVVALGRLVARTLTEDGIPHLALRHPAARGAGRARERYRAHVRSVLQGNAHVHACPGCSPILVHGLPWPPGVLPHGDLGGG